jgi:hypothetical protein
MFKKSTGFRKIAFNMTIKIVDVMMRSRTQRGITKCHQESEICSVKCCKYSIAKFHAIVQPTAAAIRIWNVVVLSNIAAIW